MDRPRRRLLEDLAVGLVIAVLVAAVLVLSASAEPGFICQAF